MKSKIKNQKLKVKTVPCTSSSLSLRAEGLNPVPSESGQIIIILLLAMLVALTISLSLVQSSISNLSSSSKTEQSSRAFSVAEAGIEKALGNSAITSTTVTSAETGNQSQATVSVQQNLPADGSAKAVEYPPIGKADFAHFWLADPIDPTGQVPGSRPYRQTKVTVFFGKNPVDLTDNKPAIEVNLISGNYNTTTDKFTTYVSTRYYFDSDATRITNGFTKPGGTFNCNGFSNVNTTSGTNRPFMCSADVTIPNILTNRSILMRIRVLYSSKNQPVAVGPDLTCASTSGIFCNLPPQATFYTSTGSSGQTEKTLTVFKEKSVPLPFFDYAIFSNAEIKK